MPGVGQGSQALAQLVGYQIHLTNLMAMAGAREALAVRETTPAKVTAMLFITDNPGCDQASLGRFLSVRRSGVMKLVNSLSARGLIERRTGRDLRSNSLFLTKAGEAFLEEVLKILKAAEVVLCAGLSAAERTELLRLLSKIQQAAGIARAPANACA